MKFERNYDFCKRLLEVHKRNRRDRSLTPGADEFSFSSPVRILMPPDAGEIIETAAKDFADYLFRSMNVTAYVDYDDGTDAPNTVRLALSDKLGKANERRGHRITVGSNVTVEGFDEAGVAQGLYYCEDVMNLREAPFLQKGVETRRVMFSPRTVQSGYGGNEYPDDYLALLAHHGFSAIALWIKGPNESLKGYTNFTDIATRAARYGFDIYVQCFTRHDVYPIGDEAQEYYDHMYGDLFAQFPFIKGLSIVGEAVKFQTRDPSLPEGVKPGWWPCSDWPLLLQMIRNAVDKVRPDVEIILSSYNWGYCDYRLRQKLIASLPKGVTLSCGWEMFEHYDLDGDDGDVRIPREITANEYVRDCIAKGLELLERLEKHRAEMGKDIIIAPPVWYGCTSYAVRGPEGYSVDMDGMVLNQTMYNIYMSMLKSGLRNIYTVIAHQTENFNPTETACLDASRRVIFKYLEDTRGIGWWGDNKSREFYNTMDSKDNPWNWLRVSSLRPHSASVVLPGDHAGKVETSMIWALRPELVREDKIGTSEDWFTETAAEGSAELGEERIRTLLECWDAVLDK